MFFGLKKKFEHSKFHSTLRSQVVDDEYGNAEGTWGTCYHDEVRSESARELIFARNDDEMVEVEFGGTPTQDLSDNVEDSDDEVEGNQDVGEIKEYVGIPESPPLRGDDFMNKHGECIEVTLPRRSERKVKPVLRIVWGKRIVLWFI